MKKEIIIFGDRDHNEGTATPRDTATATATTQSTFVQSPVRGNHDHVDDGGDINRSALICTAVSNLVTSKSSNAETSEPPEHHVLVPNIEDKEDRAQSSECPLSIAPQNEHDEDDMGKTEANIMVCREWETDFNATMAKSVSKELSAAALPESVSAVPEKDVVLWIIKDFLEFRRACKVTELPPLMSPDFGMGCHLRLSLYDKKKHISGMVELPVLKSTKESAVHVKLSVVRSDMKVIITRSVQMLIHHSDKTSTRRSMSTSAPVYLSKSRPFRSPSKKQTSSQILGYQHLIHDNVLRIKIQLQYFPFDSPVFRGAYILKSMDGQVKGAHTDMFLNNFRLHCNSQRYAELLRDIRTYCQEEPSQNVELRRDDVIFHSCKFLLCARSKVVSNEINEINIFTFTEGHERGGICYSVHVMSTVFRQIFSTHNCIPLKRGWPFNGFYVRQTDEKTQPLTSLTIRDIPVDVLDEILIFIHTDTCPWLEESTKDILKILELFEAADLYGVDALASRLIEYLSRRMDIDNFVYMFEVSQRCKNEAFKQICSNFMDSIPGSQVATLMRATQLGYTSDNIHV